MACRKRREIIFFLYALCIFFHFGFIFLGPFRQLVILNFITELTGSVMQPMAPEFKNQNRKKHLAISKISMGIYVSIIHTSLKCEFSCIRTIFLFFKQCYCSLNIRSQMQLINLQIFGRLTESSSCTRNKTSCCFFSEPNL